MKKQLYVPYIEGLTDAKIQNAGGLLLTNGVKSIINSVNWHEYPYLPEVSFCIGRSETSIFIHYQVKGQNIKALYSNDQEPVWMDSCVEFFCKREDQDGYFNFEFNCIGAALSAVHKTRENRFSRPDSEMIRIKRYSSLGTKPFEEKKGIFSWALTVEIPFDLIGLNSKVLPEKLLANFYKCGDATTPMHYVSWNPIDTEKPDFHRPDFFGELLF